jgi:hypothetical protein
MGLHIHIHAPKFLKAIGKAVGSVGHVVGNVVAKIDKIPGLGIALQGLALAVPGADIAVTAFDVVNATVKVGKMVKKKSPVVAAAESAIPPQAQQGFQAGVGLLSQPEPVTPAQFAAFRNALPTQADKDGFDMATALQVGGVQGPPPPAGLDPAAQAGWFIAHGAVHGLPGTQGNTVQNLIGTPLAGGAEQAAAAIHTKHHSWWHKLLVKLKLADDLSSGATATTVPGTAGTVVTASAASAPAADASASSPSSPAATSSPPTPPAPPPAPPAPSPAPSGS